jgi:hypothetical protein
LLTTQTYWLLSGYGGDRPRGDLDRNLPQKNHDSRLHRTFVARIRSLLASERLAHVNLLARLFCGKMLAMLKDARVAAPA